MTAAVVAAAWPLAPRWGRAVIATAAVLSVWHGIGVMRQVRHVGEVEAVFTPALADVLRHRDDVVRLLPQKPDDAWIYTRLSHGLPAQGTVHDRVRIVPQGSASDWLVTADGRLEPTR